VDAIMPKYPDNRKLVLKNINLPVGTTISFLSTKAILQWKQNGENIEVALPEYNPNTIKSPYAYVIKIEHYGKYIAKPKADIVYSNALQPTITLTSPTEGAAIYYTTDGTTPTKLSALYNKSFTVSATTNVKAVAIKDGFMNSDILERTVKAYDLMKHVIVRDLNKGLNYKYFEADAMSIDKIAQLQPIKIGIANEIDTKNKNRNEKYGFVFDGYIRISKTAMYDFYISSDDGSMLYIDDQLIINNDGNHGMGEKSDKAYLEMGLHKIKIIYFDAGGDNGLKVNYSSKGTEKISIPGSILYHQ